MLTRMQNIIQTILRQTKKQNTTVFDTEPTKWSWAQKIESYDAVPDIYKSFFAPFLSTGQTFPYTVLTPPFDKFIYKTIEKLICDLGDEIVILERNGNTFEAQRYPIDGISYIEVRSILLDSQIKICGLTRDDVNTSSTLKFNSVTDFLFEPILEKIRLAGVHARNADLDYETGKFNHLMDASLKFMNYARHSVLKGEEVINFILQLEIQKSILRFLWTVYYKTIHPTHMVILTDWELILIREERITNDRGKYGGIWDFIPLCKIEKLSLTERDRDLLLLSIQISGPTSLELPFQVSVKSEVNQLIARFEELTAI